MKLGGEPKKVAILGVLIAVGGYFFYTNVLSDDNAGHAPPPQKTGGALSGRNAEIGGAVNSSPAARGPVVRGSSRARSSEEFHPSMKRKPEETLDPTTVDPKIRLDLLARLEMMNMDTTGRNPFKWGQPPPPPAPPAPKVDPKELEEAKAAAVAAAAKPPEPTKDTGPPKPPPLNLPWKYYGYTTPRGSPQKKAFFLDGEEILTANEGEVIRRKYKVVRIGVNSAILEDMDTKSQQTLPLQEEAVG